MVNFTRAYDLINSRVVHINDLSIDRRGDKANCKCVECGETVWAYMGEHNGKHFRHALSTNCNGGPMTALHIAAQQVLTGTHAIQFAEEQVRYFDGKKGSSDYECLQTLLCVKFKAKVCAFTL